MSKFDTAHDSAWNKLQKTLGRDPSEEESTRLEGELFQQWIDEKRFDDLIQHLHETYDLEGGHIDCIVLGKALRDASEIERVHTLFRGLVTSRSRAFWRSWPEAEKGNVGQMRDAAKYYASCMEVLAEYYHNLWALKLEDAQAALKLEMLQFQSRTKPPPPARQRRGMTEKQFWALIASAREQAGSATQFASALEAALSASTPEDIRKFDDHVAARLADLNAWDLWAFAHLARGGCSDDSFDYFRAWIIAMGKAAFEAALRGPDDLLKVYEDCWDLQCEELLSVARDAHRAVTGKEMSRPTRKATPMRGERWTEGDLERRYPEVFRYFSAR